MKKDNLDINILPILMKKVFKKVWYRLISYVAANNNMPKRIGLNKVRVKHRKTDLHLENTHEWILWNFQNYA